MGMRGKTNVPALHYAGSDPGFLASAFGAGGLRVFAGFVFALALADLLLDFFGDEVNRGVKVALGVLGKEVGSRHGEPHGTVELFFRSLSMVMLERHTSVNGEAVEVVELVDPRHDMVLDGFGERHVMGRENQFHEQMMISTGQKIQSKRFDVFPIGSPDPSPGKTEANIPPLPGPLLHPMEEREFLWLRAVPR